MKKNFLKTAAVVLSVAMCATVGAGCKKGGGNYAAKNTEFYIGASGPLTGDYSIYGVAVKNGAALAVKEINKVSESELGFKFKWDIRDDEAGTEKVKGNYSDMYEKGMQASLGCVTSGSCIEFKNYAIDDNVFVLAPSATADDVTKNASNIYQMCFSDSGQGVASAAYVKANIEKTQKIGVLYKSDDPYSAGINKNFMDSMKGSGYDITERNFTKDTSTDFSQQIEALKQCDFIFMPLYTTDASKFITQAKASVKKTAVYFGCDGFDGIQTVKGFDVESFDQEISYLSHFDSSSKEGKSGEFVKNYTAAYGSDSLNQFGASAYDCVYAVYEALKFAKAAGKDVKVNMSASDVCNMLKEVFQNASFSFDGVTGSNITWNAEGLVQKTPLKYSVNHKAA